MPTPMRIVICVLLAITACWISYSITRDVLAGEGRITVVREWRFVFAVAGFACLLGLEIRNKLTLRKFRERPNE